VKVLDTFMKHLRKKQLEMVAQDWFFHWDNAPIHTAAVVQTWIAANRIQLLHHPPYFPGLAPPNFFLFRKVKEELDGIRFTLETIKTTWEGVIRGFGAEEFAAAFRQWLYWCNKCIQIYGGYVEKS
jgi:hypothetical protein